MQKLDKLEYMEFKRETVTLPTESSEGLKAFLDRQSIGLTLTVGTSIPDISTVTTVYPTEEHKPDGVKESQENHGMES